MENKTKTRSEIIGEQVIITTEGIELEYSNVETGKKEVIGSRTQVDKYDISVAEQIIKQDLLPKLDQIKQQRQELVQKTIESRKLFSIDDEPKIKKQLEMMEKMKAYVDVKNATDRMETLVAAETNINKQIDELRGRLN
jgi:hypothetical protein